MNRQEYLLTSLAEEASEIVHSTTKALRFGLDEIQPGKTETNATRIISEIEDLMIIVEMLQIEGVLPYDEYKAESLAAKRAKIERYMEFARECGTLQDSSKL